MPDSSVIAVDRPEPAAYLLTHGIELVGTRESGRFLQFLFPAGRSPEIFDLLKDYSQGGKVSARVFSENLRRLRIQVAEFRRSIEVRR